MALTLVDTSVGSRDPANRKIQKKIMPNSLSYPLVQTKRLGSVICHRELTKKSYPLAEISFPAKRSVFRYEVGDLFVLTYDLYNITNMVCRVVKTEEQSPESEIITIYAKEDIYYISSTVVADIPTSRGTQQDMTARDLVYVQAFEVPYSAIEVEDVRVGVLAGRVVMKETGFLVYGGLDSTSYTRLDNHSTYAVHGLLVGSYTSDTHTIDDATGFEVDFDNTDVENITTISRSQLFTNVNLAILGTPTEHEIIAFQTITPVAGGAGRRYAIENIIRGLYDTEKLTHTAGAHFTFLGGGYKILDQDWFINGSTRYFKLLAHTAKSVSTLAGASAVSVTLTGRAFKPYRPTNLKCNGKGVNATYSIDCVLTWTPRKRTQGAGFGDADTVTDASPTYEGFFRVRVYVGGVLVRTQTPISALTWTYTSAMNISDNGSLATNIVFRLLNCQTTGGATYCSAYTSLSVRKV